MKRFLMFIIPFFIIIGALFVISPWFFFGINTTNSLDGYLFFIVKNEIPEKGDLVAFYPPKNQFYKTRWFVKYLIGEEGDRIEYKNNKLYLNGEFKGNALEKARNGEKLEKTENKVIEKNKIFVWTPHVRSYDSRYKGINTIDISRIIGTAYRIF